MLIVLIRQNQLFRSLNEITKRTNEQPNKIVVSFYNNTSMNSVIVLLKPCYTCNISKQNKLALIIIFYNNPASAFDDMHCSKQSNIFFLQVSVFLEPGQDLVAFTYSTVHIIKHVMWKSA